MIRTHGQPVFHQDEIQAATGLRPVPRGSAFEANTRFFVCIKKTAMRDAQLTRAKRRMVRETIVPLIQTLENRRSMNDSLRAKDGAIRDLPTIAASGSPCGVEQERPQAPKSRCCPRFLRGLFIALKESDRHD